MIRYRLVNWIVRAAFRTVCRVDAAELKKIPSAGPMIVVGNHVNFMEAPVVLAFYDNPAFTGIAKRESWKNPLFFVLFNTWGIIPIDRGMVDREAFRLSLDALAAGKILALSPEGTRSKDGRLLPGKPGVVAIAQRSDAPLTPVGFYGHVNFWENMKHLRRTDFHVAVGKPFRISNSEEALARENRQAVTDEIMMKIAEQLPPEYRGTYATDGPVQYRFLEDA